MKSASAEDAEPREKSAAMLARAKGAAAWSRPFQSTLGRLPGSQGLVVVFRSPGVSASRAAGGQG